MVTVERLVGRAGGTRVAVVRVAEVRLGVGVGDGEVELGVEVVTGG